MITKEEFIADLEKLIGGTMSAPSFKAKYLIGPGAREVVGVTDGSAPNLPGNLGHLVDRDDSRETESFRRVQRAELEKLILLLKSNAPASELDRFHFYGAAK